MPMNDFMSISTTKNDQQPQIKKPLLIGKVFSAVSQICQNAPWKIFDLCLIFSLIITGLGLLFGVNFPWYWIAIVFLLIIIEVLLDFFCRMPAKEAKQNNYEDGGEPAKS